jgi:hypothetical protein
MKTIIIFCLLTLSTFSFAQDQVTVIKTLHSSENKVFITIEENTFERNVQGYACSWPGLRVPFVFYYLTKLKHFSDRTIFGENVLPIAFEDLQNRFCGGVVAQDVFGPEFVIGAKVTIVVQVKREIVEMKNHEGVLGTYLRESINSNLMGQKLESTAFVSLDDDRSI